MKSIDKNKLAYLLLLVTFTIWGIIIFKIYTHFSQPEETIVEIDGHRDLHPESLANMGRAEQILFTSLERDPFTFIRPVYTKELEKVQITKDSPIPPPIKLSYRINGVVVGEKSKLVIFEDRSANKTVFLREGESYGGIKIKAVTIKNITLIENGEYKVIKVER